MALVDAPQLREQRPEQAMLTASSTALPSIATSMPTYSAAALIGMSPSGDRPWLIIMMAITLPRISWPTASWTMLMLSEPMREPASPTQAPTSMAAASDSDSANASRNTAQT